MLGILFTSENCKYLKKAFLRAYQMRSSHLSEAMASGFGFKSNIAMQTALRSASSTPAEFADFSEERFNRRATELGYGIPGNAVDWSTFGAHGLPQKAWLLTTANAGSTSYFYECKRHKRPFVTVTRRRTLCRLDWDCITIDGQYDATINTYGNKYVDFLFTIFQETLRGTQNRAMFDGSAFVGHIANLPLSVAPPLANGIFRLLFSASGGILRH